MGKLDNLQLMNAKDMEATPYPSLLLIGENGTHKTYFIGTCPAPLLYDFDGTPLVLRGKNIPIARFKDAPKGSKVVNPKIGIYEWGTAYPKFLEHLNKVGGAIEEPDFPYKTIALDSLTSLGRIALNYVLKETGYVVGPKTPVDPGTWGFQSGLMQAVCEQINAWPVIKVLTAHVQRDSNAVTGNVEKLPLTTGKFAAGVGSLYDETYYTEATGTGANQKFVFRTSQDGILKHAKSPLGVPDKTEIDWKNIEKYLLPKAA